MITIAGVELGMKRYHDIMSRVAENDKQQLRDHKKACSDAIEALEKGHIRHAQSIISDYFETSSEAVAQEAE